MLFAWSIYDLVMWLGGGWMETMKMPDPFEDQTVRLP